MFTIFFKILQSVKYIRLNIYNFLQDITICLFAFTTEEICGTLAEILKPKEAQHGL